MIEVKTSAVGACANCSNEEIGNAVLLLMEQIPNGLEAHKSAKWELRPHDPHYGDVLGGAFVAVRWSE